MAVNFQRCSTLRLDLKVGFIHVDSSLLKVLIREIAVYNCIYTICIYYIWCGFRTISLAKSVT